MSVPTIVTTATAAVRARVRPFALGVFTTVPASGLDVGAPSGRLVFVDISNGSK